MGSPMDSLRAKATFLSGYQVFVAGMVWLFCELKTVILTSGYSSVCTVRGSTSRGPRVGVISCTILLIGSRLTGVRTSYESFPPRPPLLVLSPTDPTSFGAKTQA